MIHKRTYHWLSLWTVILVLVIVSCKPEPKAPVHSVPTTPTEKRDILDEVDNEGRIVWQKPEQVVNLLGDISEKKIADIGAGSGYFTFRFALKASKVIAVEIDPSMIQIIETFKNQLPKELQGKIETRLALPDDPKLEEGEVDIIAIINTIGYIENRTNYLETLKKALSENGEIFILDFKTKNLPINAPPMDERVPLGTLENELIAAGYKIKTSDDRTLDYQYIVKAEK